MPSPREISVERQLTKSILISWSPPYNAITSVAHYHVCVNGVVRAVVPGGYKTKALIENVDINKVMLHIFNALLRFILVQICYRQRVYQFVQLPKWDIRRMQPVQ